MINYQEAEKEIKQHIKNRKDLCLDMVDISADILSILRNLDDKTCADCSRRQMYQSGYKSGYEDGMRAGKGKTNE